MTTLKRIAAAISLASLIPLSVYAADSPDPAKSKGTVEVLHWWTSGGEAAAAKVLRELVEKDGYTWKDNAVAGGGGEAAMTVLKSRAVAGNPPGAAQIKGPAIQEWAKLGFLTTLDDLAKAENWAALIPTQIGDVMKYDGHYVAVPLNIHRVNWLWINPEAFTKAGIANPPTTLDELYAAGDKLKAAGIIPLAHGSERWQDSTVFEDVVLSVLGADGFHKAFVDKDKATLTGPKMQEAFVALKKLRGYMDPDMAGRQWNDATNMVINGKAGMQIMGDWAKSEWTAARKVAGKDYQCIPFPGTQGSFTYNVDSLAMFKLKDKNDIAAQNDLAKIALGEKFQTVFNENKGSIPIRKGMDLKDFDSCAQKSAADFKEAEAGKGLQPTMAHGMATSTAVQGAIFDVVSNFFKDDKGDPKQAVKQLATAVMQ